MSDKVYQIPGDMLAAFKTRPLSEWKEFFHQLRVQKSEQIVSCQGAESLLKLQAAIVQINELEQFILSEMRR